MDRRKKRLVAPWITGIGIGVVCFFSGWLVATKNISSSIVAPQALRLNGYQFIDPLLVCNVNNSNVFQENQSLSSSLSSLINSGIKSGSISKASVYFADLANGKWANVNPSEMYYPSSLGKIPIMIAYYEIAETDPSILKQTITYPIGSSDLNDTQDIKPAETIVPGQTYTVEQLIEYMIRDSDNNATQLLYNAADQAALQNVYGQLGIPVDNNPTLANLDFITTQQVGLLFRILYNSTYLSRDYSEKALELMSESSFTQGIVAGIQSPTVVSHKLGLVGIAPNGVTTEHELHDCGIVYAKDPYLLCVMTRGASPLTTMEGVIASISRAAYESVENGG